MKYVILRCEDTARGGERLASLLEGAKAAHLAHLAQAGAAGTIRASGDPAALDRARLHRALVGLRAQDGAACPGRWYVASANLTLAPGETAWCCELVTQRDGRILDPTAGNIPTKESTLLVHALDEQLGSDARRWEIGHGWHHLCITREPALAAAGEPTPLPPELLIGQPWERHLPRGGQGEALRALVGQASKLLEAHPVNRVRVDLGENPANLLWLWGASDAAPVRTFTEQTGRSGAVISRSFLTRGLARALSLDWSEAPASMEEPAFHRLLKAVVAALERHDLVYVHLGVETANAVERLCALERIDQLLLQPLTDRLRQAGPGRLLAVVDHREPSWLPFVAIGPGLAQQPIAHLNTDEFAASPLTFKDASGLFSWFTKD